MSAQRAVDAGAVGARCLSPYAEHRCGYPAANDAAMAAVTAASRGPNYRSGVPVRADIQEPRFLTLKEVASYLNVGESQVYALLRSTALPAIRVGGRGRWRVDRERLDRYVEGLHADTAASLERARRTRPRRRPLDDGAATLTTIVGRQTAPPAGTARR